MAGRADKIRSLQPSRSLWVSPGNAGMALLPTYEDLPDDLVSLVPQGKSFSACEACLCAGGLWAFCLLRREKTCHNVIASQ